jgi:hypothetical protein
MTDRVNRVIAAHARRIARDPTSASVDDARKLARAVLRLLGENVPDEVR